MKGRFSSQVRVRLSETDALGVVYYGNYLAYFDMSRLEMLRAAGISVSYLKQRKMGFVAAESHCRYLSSARFDDLLTLNVGVVRVGRSSVRYHHEICKGRREIADGLVTDVLVDSSGKPTQIPAGLRAKLEKFMVGRGNRNAKSRLKPQPVRRVRADS